MRKDDFESLYNSYKIKELCDMLDCSAPTLYKRIKEYDIKKKGQGKGKRTRNKLIIED